LVLGAVRELARWRKRGDVLERRLPDGVVLLPVDSDAVTVLAGSGGQLWELLTEPRTTDELSEDLTRRYAGDPNTIRSDIETVLCELERDGLVRRQA
jgi:hypothetical protein